MPTIGILAHALREHLREQQELSPEEQRERQIVAKQYPKNPFVYQSKMSPHTFTIGFKTMTRKTTDPLWWTGSGFSNLATVRGEPEEFETKAAAETKLRSEILDFIRKWRGDQVHLIIGWG
jgi:hypothetical protein